MRLWDLWDRFSAAGSKETPTVCAGIFFGYLAHPMQKPPEVKKVVSHFSQSHIPTKCMELTLSNSKPNAIHPKQSQAKPSNFSNQLRGQNRAPFLTTVSHRLTINNTDQNQPKPASTDQWNRPPPDPYKPPHISPDHCLLTLSNT